MKHFTDREIVALFIKRDETALRATQERYGRYLLTVALQLLADREDAEECVSDCLLTAWNKIPPEKPKLLKYYLAKIVRQIAFNRVRHNSAAKRGGDALTQPLHELAECLPDRNRTEDAILEQDLMFSINGFLETLLERDRDVFLRRYFYAEDTAEIAKRYNIKKDHVLLILSRTRKKLATQLIREGRIDDSRKIV